MRKIFLLLAIVTICCGNLAAQNLSGEYLLQTIESLYNNGQYISAELEARRLQEQSGMSDSVRVQTEKWIAFSLIAQGKSSAAKERFVSLLRIDDAFELDPVLTSPKILSVFNDAKVKYFMQKKTAAADSSAFISRLLLQQPQPVTYRTALFPGWEQLHQGRETMGWIFLGSGAVTLASGLTCEFLRADARSAYLKETAAGPIDDAYKRYNNYRKAEIYSFSAFVLIYIASEVDVFTNTNVSVQPAYSQNLGNQLLLTVRF
ncbi:MAG: hypothetical protein ACOYNS_12910 [Bacteroidota bacterium]